MKVFELVCGNLLLWFVFLFSDSLTVLFKLVKNHFGMGGILLFCKHEVT